MGRRFIPAKPLFGAPTVVHAVSGVDLAVEEGETFAIVGESGCGKSTLLRMIAGLEEINGGTIAIDDEVINDLAPKDRDIAMVFQSYALYPHMTVAQNMEYALRLKKVPRADRDEKIARVAGILGLTPYLDRMPKQLSGGQRQRVMIAMALACEPRLLIADEPTTALDVTIQAEIMELLMELCETEDMGLILITHDRGIVARVADRVAVMYAGQVVESGDVKQIFESPTHPYTQGLLDFIPIPGKTPPGAHLGSIPGIVPALIGEQKGCSFSDRCKYAVVECIDRRVDLTAATDAAHASRCVLAADQCAPNWHRERAT